MEKKSDRGLEDLLRGSVFRNPGHKEQLLKRLAETERTVRLSAEDLDGVVGGVSFPEAETWTAWPDEAAEERKP